MLRRRCNNVVLKATHALELLLFCTLLFTCNCVDFHSNRFIFLLPLYFLVSLFLVFLCYYVCFYSSSLMLSLYPLLLILFRMRFFRSPYFPYSLTSHAIYTPSALFLYTYTLYPFPSPDPLPTPHPSHPLPPTYPSTLFPPVQFPPFPVFLLCFPEVIFLAIADSPHFVLIRALQIAQSPPPPSFPFTLHPLPPSLLSLGGSPDFFVCIVSFLFCVVCFLCEGYAVLFMVD